jgi:hypothetical protein
MEGRLAELGDTACIIEGIEGPDHCRLITPIRGLIVPTFVRGFYMSLGAAAPGPRS